MKLVFVDIDRERFLPFAFTRPLAKLRVGILTLEEKWFKRLGAENCSYDTEDYLSTKFSNEANADSLFINPLVFPTHDLVEKVQGLNNGESLWFEDVWIARKGKESSKVSFSEVNSLNTNWDIFHKNGYQIRADFELITK